MFTQYYVGEYEMAIKVLAPRLGEGVDELTIVKWLKLEGETVAELEPLLEVETDKVVTQIPSPAAGQVLKIAVRENTPARVGEVMAWIGQPGESVPVSGAPVSSAPISKGNDQYLEERSGVQVPSPVGGDSLGFLSPVVRKIASEHHVDLNRVHGTGSNGRITKQDVLAFIEHSPAGGETGKVDTEARDTGTLDTFIPITIIRRQIAERMLLSRQTSPHVLTVMEADLGRVAAHRLANKAAYTADGLNLTYTAYFVAAIVAGLKAFPLVNSSWTDKGILVRARINVGMATSLGEEGLIVPVIKDAQDLSLRGIAQAVNDLSNRARLKKLQPEEVRDGTFTLTNHGTGGSLLAMPIINQPQAGILGTGAIQKRPVVVTDANGNDAIAIRPMVYLSFVFDHRILDGASADLFLARVRETLEVWHD
jgi:2-oxoglutarate dehydrogenase E2 component (dihydrolipoamide succinyltransferase)